MGTSKTSVSYFLLLLPFLYIQIFYGLGDLGLVGPDEPRYAEVAKEMVRNRDYVTPRLSGQPWLEKPILYYWITTLCFRLFGVSEFAARLPSALAAVLGAIVVVLVGQDWMGFRGGVHAGLILLSCILYFSLARAASTDMLLAGTLTAAWAGFYFLLFRKVPSPAGSPAIAADVAAHASSQFALTVLSYFFLALAVLAKGPVGLILCGAVLVAFLLLTRRLELIKPMRVGLGLITVIVVAGPWYWLCYRANGHLFTEEFLLRQNVERFTTSRYQHLQPFWFYFAVIFVGSFPWVFQLVASLRRFFHSAPELRTNPTAAKELYLWLWVLVPLVFFSLSKSKLPGYILPAVPSIALLVAREFETASPGEGTNSSSKWIRWTAFAQALLISVFGLTLSYTQPYLNIEIGASMPGLRGIFVTAGALGLVLSYWKRFRLLLATYLTATAVTVMFIVSTVIPRLEPLESTRQLAFRLKKEGFSGQTIFLLGLSRRVEYGLNFYLDTTTRVIYSEDDLRATKADGFLLTPVGLQLKPVPRCLRVESEATFHRERIVKLGWSENSSGQDDAKRTQ